MIALWCSLVASVEDVVVQRVVELDRAGVEQLYQHCAIHPPQQQVLHGCTTKKRNARCRCSSQLTCLNSMPRRRGQCSEGSSVGSEEQGVLGEAVGDELLR